MKLFVSGALVALVALAPTVFGEEIAAPLTPAMPPLAGSPAIPATAGAPAGAASTSARHAVRGRLAAAKAEEERLERSVAQIRRGIVAPIETASLAGAPLPLGSPSSEPLGAAWRPLQNDDEVAFERARVDALKARVERARRERAEHPSPTRPSPTEPAPHSSEVISASFVAPPESRSEARPIRAPETVAVVVSSQPTGPRVALSPADGLRLADALLATADLEGAAQAYADAAAGAEKSGDHRAYVRARYGHARSCERLGRVDAALEEYAAIPALAEAGEWGKAAAFSRRFLEWRRKLDGASRASPTPATAPVAKEGAK